MVILQFDAVGIELSAAYVVDARRKLESNAPLLSEVRAPPAADPQEARVATLFEEPEA